MTPKTLLRVSVLITAIAALSAPSSSFYQNPQTDGYQRQTSVRLTGRRPDGQVISLTRADNYLDLWEGGQLVSLPRDGPSATLRLDQDWLCIVWTDVCKYRMYGPARLILQADGYAPVTGMVYWPGQQRPGDRSPATSARLEFSRGRDIGIEEGTRRNYNIAFRRPLPRMVRIVDESGNPAAGISLDASIYFEATNHMGVVEGESVVQGKTDANGQMSVPDVDGELAVELQRGRFVLRDPDRVSPFRKIITPGITAAVTTLVLHRFQKQPLNIDFINKNGSSDGLILGSCMKFCSRACCGDVAMTSSAGQVRIEDFYPEEIDSLYLTDKSGTFLWRGSVHRVGNPSNLPTITVPVPSR